MWKFITAHPVCKIDTQLLYAEFSPVLGVLVGLNTILGDMQFCLIAAERVASQCRRSLAQKLYGL